MAPAQTNLHKPPGWHASMERGCQEACRHVPAAGERPDPAGWLPGAAPPAAAAPGLSPQRRPAGRPGPPSAAVAASAPRDWSPAPAAL